MSWGRKLCNSQHKNTKGRSMCSLSPGPGLWFTGKNRELVNVWGVTEQEKDKIIGFLVLSHRWCALDTQPSWQMADLTPGMANSNTFWIQIYCVNMYKDHCGKDKLKIFSTFLSYLTRKQGKCTHTYVCTCVCGLELCNWPLLMAHVFTSTSGGEGITFYIQPYLALRK